MYRGASVSGFWIPLLWVGLQAPAIYWLPAGTPSVRQKERPFTNTAEVCGAVAGGTGSLYHGRDGLARGHCGGRVCGRVGAALQWALAGHIARGRGPRRGESSDRLGMLLAILGVWGYLAPAEHRSLTAFIPTAVGLVLVVLGAVATRWEDARKHAMHAAAAVGLLGFLVAAGRFLYKLFSGGKVMRHRRPQHADDGRPAPHLRRPVCEVVHRRPQTAAQGRGGGRGRPGGKVALSPDRSCP